MTKSSPLADQPIVIRAEPIELCQLLKFAGLVESGGAAKQAISDGLVQLNGAVETQKRKKIMAGDRVSFDGQTLVVSLA
ncbi:MAG: RNA-binding S4 domain-containing protein [Opitutaceae bacterium]|nr:RNA-binding S4 domain-containing protein [Opitutaceae bacterium]MBP9912977.1 RNA-binding S4 domain-containing protein [Opitutaceae bacterium]